MKEFVLLRLLIHESLHAVPSIGIIRAVRNYTAKGGLEAKHNPASPEDKTEMMSWLKTGSEDGPIYRGFGFSEKKWTDSEFERWTTVGSIVPLTSVTSFTRDHERIGSYAGGNFAVFLTVDGQIAGRDISLWSIYPEEREVLLAPRHITIVSAKPHPNTNGSSWDISAR